MGSVTIREQLHKQIDVLPDEIVEQIADFTAFFVAKREIEIERSQWQDFALAQFFREDDEVEYTLDDAQKVLTACFTPTKVGGRKSDAIQSNLFGQRMWKTAVSLSPVHIIRKTLLQDAASMRAKHT